EARVCTMTEMAWKSPVDFGRSRAGGSRLGRAFRLPLLAEPGAGPIVEHLRRGPPRGTRPARLPPQRRSAPPDAPAAGPRARARRAAGRERRRQVHETDVLADCVAPASAPQPSHDAVAGVHGFAAVEV